MGVGGVGGMMNSAIGSVPAKSEGGNGIIRSGLFGGSCTGNRQTGTVR